MLRSFSVLVISLALVACAKDKAKEQSPTASPPPPPPAADAAAKGSADGSAAGSADAGSAAAGSDAGSAAGSGAVAASDFHFDDLTHDEKVKFMKQKVMPTMKPLFQKFDPKEFAKFTCKTCHGKEPPKVKYEMPSADLPALDFEAIEAGKEDPKMVEFMNKVVKPEMAKLLNEPEQTETQPEGFGCLDCHTMKK